MRKEKNLTINGINYEIKRFVIPMWLENFYVLYARPSQTKVEIYKEWYKVLNSVYGCTGSKFAFTIY